MVSKSIITCFVIYFVFPDESPEQEILRLNNVLAEYISANNLLKNENHNLLQQLARLKSEFKEEQLDTVFSVKKETSSDNGL